VTNGRTRVLLALCPRIWLAMQRQIRSKVVRFETRKCVYTPLRSHAVVQVPIPFYAELDTMYLVYRVKEREKSGSRSLSLLFLYPLILYSQLIKENRFILVFVSICETHTNQYIRIRQILYLRNKVPNITLNH
jgi:hypothetical protein